MNTMENQPPPLADWNLYSTDRAPRNAAEREGAGWARERLRNELHLLKTKLGNRSNASSEVEFHGARARLLGEEGRRFLNRMGEPDEADARRLSETLALALQASLMTRFAPPGMADAFCASRLEGDWGPAFGTLPRRAAFDPAGAVFG
ncbi:MAG: hypothetical protein LC126_14365 [Bryobacterales bacterium]|nr:hypothetical protein [Bryobacterales bacterium]